MTHELKTWVEFFKAVTKGDKTFEIRKDDRGFKVNDILILKEYDHELGEYTGHELTKKISYVLQGGSFGVEKGFVILGLRTTLK